MSEIDVDFLKSGYSWDETELQGMQGRMIFQARDAEIFFNFLDDLSLDQKL
jgi:hypothetical protein